ncbi:unnamed protein product [Vitrella brassicaformis CCMP3155]|uniref:RING-type domain-containing protein n=1 Tax=Vitrella brassicaformis (strain CCMP3155) TaxID=1169540 RepID=A0A0G4FW13_VITBC|nr:unnamed protein product [Vitrella brassicaformis CCMP3155]|mmetsp:Transcript_32814/g.81274  ORF Transcript_32814/g.81274 Transcript_32814/m.81274 type:complete len:467 (-) Transcript_32814:62-1462(-)|eukprot:CEM19292.1 unnamed protein product [Vitrella brassicaformis CCMP3155]
MKTRKASSSHPSGMPSSSSSGCWAAAFQDHLMKSLSKPAAVAALSRPLQAHSRPRQPPTTERGASLQHQHRHRRKPSSSLSSAASACLSGCRPSADTDKGVTDVVSDATKRDFRVYEKSLSLAERLQLVPAPPPPLTDSQWEAVRETSEARQESHKPCAICLEEFADSPQVILSCSHVFHKRCLASFERFAQTRCCPICRRASYQRRPHHGGFLVWRHKCATRIQKAWRGHCIRRQTTQEVRQRFRGRVRDELTSSTFLTSSDPSGCGDELSSFERKCYGRALAGLSRQVLRRCDERQDALDKFLSDIDQSVQESSRILREDLQRFSTLYPQLSLVPSLPVTHRRQSPQRAAAPPNTAAAAPAGPPPPAEQQQQPLPPFRLDVTAEEWASAKRRALERDEEECSICFQEYHRGKAVLLLSCSHVFHKTCLLNFESFHVFEQHRCPVCRQWYARRPLALPARPRKGS